MPIIMMHMDQQYFQNKKLEIYCFLSGVYDWL